MSGLVNNNVVVFFSDHTLDIAHDDGRMLGGWCGEMVRW